MDLVANITTTVAQNVTTNPGGQSTFPVYVGYIGCFIAVILFGSNFLPVKKFETGDGMFFQFICCVAIWIPSVVLHAVRGFPRFWPLAMFGGVLWASGNIMVVPIIQCIGMAMGLLIWGMVNMLMGWASGRFGWFGLDPQPVKDSLMNYMGVLLCFLSAVVVSLIKPTVEQRAEKTTPSLASPPEERDPLLPSSSTADEKIVTSSGKYDTYDTIHQPDNGDVSINNSDSNLPSVGNDSWTSRLSERNKKIVGIVLCLISGAFYGSMFAPVIYIKNNYPTIYGSCTEDPCIEHVSQIDLDYVFPHFTGILLTSSFYFLVYCVFMKNKPKVYPQTILPAVACGLMWSIADIGFFTANEVLEESVSFPIISAGPGIVASLWSVLVLKEIQGKRNIVILVIAACFVTAGCVLCGLSK